MLGNIDTLLVDGYNVLHLWSHFRAMVATPDAKRRRLVALLENYATLTRVRAVVVFDGGVAGDEEIRSSGVKVVYSPKGKTADTVIEGRLGPAPERTLVVTSDRALAQVCRLRGARTRTSEAFEEDLLEFLSRSYARGVVPASGGGGDGWGRVGDRLRRDALLSLLSDLKDERARHEKERVVKEMARLREERGTKRKAEAEEIAALRRGLPADQVKRDDDEGLRLFHQMFGKRKIRAKRRDEPEEPPPAAAEDEGFDWVAAMEATLGGLDPKVKK